MPIWQLCANLLIPNCLCSNLSYSPLAALELYVKKKNSQRYLLNFSTSKLFNLKTHRNVSSKVSSNVRTGSGVSTARPPWLSRHESVAESAVL